MFGNFSMPELLIVGALALIVIGPKDLPRMMRSVGKFVGQARGLAKQFQDSMNDAAREADIQEFRDARKLMEGKADTKGITDTFSKALDFDDEDDEPDTTPKRSPVLSEEEMARVADESGFGANSAKKVASDDAPKPDTPAETPETASAETAPAETAKVS